MSLKIVHIALVFFIPPRSGPERAAMDMHISRVPHVAHRVRILGGLIGDRHIACARRPGDLEPSEIDVIFAVDSKNLRAVLRTRMDHPDSASAPYHMPIGQYQRGLAIDADDYSASEPAVIRIIRDHAHELLVPTSAYD
jgi:hypothetical protein